MAIVDDVVDALRKLVDSVLLSDGRSALRMHVFRNGFLEERFLPVRDHFALEMDHMSACVMDNKEPLTPGEEGLRDLKVMMAIYEAAKTEKAIKLA